MSGEYYIWAYNQQYGPIDQKTLEYYIQQEYLSYEDYIWSDEQQDWILVSEHPNISKLLCENITEQHQNETKDKLPNTSNANAIINEAENSSNNIVSFLLKYKWGFICGGIIIILSIAAFVVFSPMSPEKARHKIASLNYKYSVDSFLERAGQGDMYTTKLFLYSGMDIDVIDNDGWSALMFACRAGRFEVAKMLIDRGANVDIVSSLGTTALSVASFNGHKEVVKLILDAGADLKTNNKALIDAFKNKHSDIVTLLIKAGADLNVIDPYSELTVLMMAVIEGDVENINMLINAGANVNIETEKGTALILATQNKNENIVKLLLKEGADVNRKDAYGKSAMSIAINNYDVSIVSMLIKSGATAEDITFDGDPIIFRLVEIRNSEMAMLLIEKGAVDVNQKDSLGESILSHVMFRRSENSSDLDLIKALIKSGADINAYYSSEFGNDGTPLTQALSVGFEEGVKLCILLIELGADVNIKNSKGLTALTLANRNCADCPSYNKLIRLLRRAGAH